jgi:DNA (cytosine-5)-methyltransferase 1
MTTATPQPNSPGASLVDSVRGPKGKPAVFRFIDLFAGIGGLRLGLEAAGGECVYSVEIDAWARKTYEANHGACEGRDIRDVHDRQILQPYDVLAAGFPCQPFSLAGVSKKRSLGRKHGFEDELSGGNLFFEILRLIDERVAPPPVVFLENVKNLLRHDEGRTFQRITSELEQRGYVVTHQVVDSSPWVPQRRQRTFVVGMLGTVFDGMGFDFPQLGPVSETPRLGTILDPDPPSRYQLSPRLWAYLQEYAIRHRAAGHGFGYGLFGPDDVARTLSARYYKDGSEILIRDPRGTPRRLTPRECARLMGFPETFVIPAGVSDNQAYRQFGNSVVVPVVRWLAIQLVNRHLVRMAAAS